MGPNCLSRVSSLPSPTVSYLNPRSSPPHANSSLQRNSISPEIPLLLTDFLRNSSNFTGSSSSSLCATATSATVVSETAAPLSLENIENKNGRSIGPAARRSQNNGTVERGRCELSFFFFFKRRLSVANYFFLLIFFFNTLILVF